MKVLSNKGLWAGVFVLLFLASLHWGDVTTVHLSQWGFPRFIFYFIGLQMLLAAAVWGFATHAWEPEASEHSSLLENSPRGDA